MLPPETLEVVGKHYTVTAVPGMFDDGNAGLCDYRRHAITFDPDQHPGAVQDTVLHEVVHAVDDAMGTGMSERQVRGLATGFLAVLKANPAFLKFLSQ